MSKAISRRDFLKVTGAVGAAGLLAACGGNGGAASSTASSAAEAASVAGLSISHKRNNRHRYYPGNDIVNADYLTIEKRRKERSPPVRKPILVLRKQSVYTSVPGPHRFFLPITAGESQADTSKLRDYEYPENYRTTS